MLSAGPNNSTLHDRTLAVEGYGSTYVPIYYVPYGTYFVRRISPLGQCIASFVWHTFHEGLLTTYPTRSLIGPITDQGFIYYKLGFNF